MASTFMSMTARSTATSSACARNSKPWTTSSRKSRRFMASDTDTATVDAKAPPEPAPEAPADERITRPSRPAPGAPPEVGATNSQAERGAQRRRWGWFRRPTMSPLTRRIVAVNVLPLLLLALGFLYLGKFEASLIGQQIESLRTQGEIFAAALGEGAVLDSADEGEILLPDLSRQMMRRLVEPTRTRARLFDNQGRLIADSRLLRGPGIPVQVAELPPAGQKGLLSRAADAVYDWIAGLLPSRRKYPVYSEGEAAENYGEALRAIHGESGSAVRSDPQTGGLLISVAVPVQRYKQVLGAVMLSTGSGE